MKKSVATAVAVATLFWLVFAVNTLGNEATRGASFMLAQPPLASIDAPRHLDPAAPDSAGGVALVDMYECMCASNDDIGLWVKWWFIAATFGGIPVAVLLRSRDEAGRA